MQCSVALQVAGKIAGKKIAGKIALYFYVDQHLFLEDT